MTINKWLSSLNANLFGQKARPRTRSSQSNSAAQATLATEVLESRQLLTVVANLDVYDQTAGINEDEAFHVDAPGLLANDNIATPNGTLTVDTDVALIGDFHGTVTMNADGSFTYDPGLTLQSLVQYLFRVRQRC
ncbi:MAG: hypothetical protein V4719_28440, partial [Planctomycetota bacterium]